MTDCNECGTLGYTLKTNADGEEYMDSCFECFVEAQEAEAHKLNHCTGDDRGYHEYQYGGHRCNNCGWLHPSLN